MAEFINRWFGIAAIAMIFNTSANLHRSSLSDNEWAGQPLHPFHVSVTEINHNAAEKTLEISCKIFTDDFENALKKKFNAKIDLINPANRAAMDKYVSAYIHDHLQVKTDGKPLVLKYMGYEIETEAAYCYLQVDNISSVKMIEIANTIMYDVFTDQVGINHVIVGGNRKSVKLDYPNNLAVVQF